MKSPSWFCSAFVGGRSGFIPRITSHRSLMPSPSESQWTGLVPIANSSRSVRPSLSVSRDATSPFAFLVGSKASMISFGAISTPFAMLFRSNLEPVICTQFVPSILPTAARYQK